MSFVFTLETDNAAFDPDPRPEVCRLLRRAAQALETGSDGEILQDENGNTVGGWSLMHQPSDEEEP